MQLTRHTDYAMRTLLYLAAAPPERLVQIREISDLFDISGNHLSKIVNKLGQLGFLATQRGRGGGIRLAQSPAEINVGAVVRALEPTLDPINCGKPKCAILAHCRFKSVLSDASDAFMQIMDSYTLADMTDSETTALMGLS